MEAGILDLCVAMENFRFLRWDVHFFKLIIGLYFLKNEIKIIYSEQKQQEKEVVAWIELFVRSSQLKTKYIYNMDIWSKLDCGISSLCKVCTLLTP